MKYPEFRLKILVQIEIYFILLLELNIQNVDGVNVNVGDYFVFLVKNLVETVFDGLVVVVDLNVIRAVGSSQQVESSLRPVSADGPHFEMFRHAAHVTPVHEFEDRTEGLRPRRVREVILLTPDDLALDGLLFRTVKHCH